MQISQEIKWSWWTGTKQRRLTLTTLWTELINVFVIDLQSYFYYIPLKKKTSADFPCLLPSIRRPWHPPLSNMNTSYSSKLKCHFAGSAWFSRVHISACVTDCFHFDLFPSALPLARPVLTNVLLRPFPLMVSISLKATVWMCYRDVLKSCRSVHLSVSLCAVVLCPLTSIVSCPALNAWSCTTLW